MKDLLLEIIKDVSFQRRGNVLREYLQAYILRILYLNNFFKNCAFLGGTALRFAYNLRRYSEDLDFSLIKKKNFKFEEISKIVKKELEMAGFSVELKINTAKCVNYAFFKFKEILNLIELTSNPKQLFSVKIEADLNPPGGEILEMHSIVKYFPFSFISYDLETILAGKICAIFCRKYIKGRDFFDLIYILLNNEGIVPNISFLNNALKQFNWNGRVEKREWLTLLKEKAQHLNWRKIEEDVEKFLENTEDLKFINKKTFLELK